MSCHGRCNGHRLIGDLCSGRVKVCEFGAAMVIIVGVIAFLAVSGVRANKSYYVTIQELNGMDREHTRATCGLQAMCCRARFGITGRMQTLYWSRTRTICGCRTRVKSLRRTRSRTMRRLWQSALTDAMASFTRRSFRRSARPVCSAPGAKPGTPAATGTAAAMAPTPVVNADLSCSWCRLPLRGRLFTLPTA